MYETIKKALNYGAELVYVNNGKVFAKSFNTCFIEVDEDGIPL